jgi:hypothetical protein
MLARTRPVRHVGSGAAKSIGAIVDKLLGDPDFFVGSRKLFPAFLDHALGLLELGQGNYADFGGFFHGTTIIPRSDVQGRPSTLNRWHVDSGCERLAIIGHGCSGAGATGIFINRL